MKIGLVERRTRQASRARGAFRGDDLDNKIAFQHLPFHVSAEEFIAAQIELAAGGRIDGPEDTREITTDYGRKLAPGPKQS
jgi:hypothetical protein